MQRGMLAAAAIALVVSVGLAGCADPTRFNNGERTNTIAGGPGGRLTNPKGVSPNVNAIQERGIPDVAATGDAGTQNARDVSNYSLGGTGKGTTGSSEGGGPPD